MLVKKFKGLSAHNARFVLQLFSKHNIDIVSATFTICQAILTRVLQTTVARKRSVRRRVLAQRSPGEQSIRPSFRNRCRMSDCKPKAKLLRTGCNLSKTSFLCRKSVTGTGIDTFADSLHDYFTVIATFTQFESDKCCRKSKLHNVFIRRTCTMRRSARRHVLQQTYGGKYRSRNPHCDSNKHADEPENDNVLRWVVGLQFVHSFTR